MKHYAYLLLPLLLAACFDDYSDGDRTGAITKLSRKGLFCKTWEGEMNLGGLKRKTNKKGSTSFVANVWQFTVEEPDAHLVPAIQAKMDAGEPVTLHYVQDFIYWPCRGSTGY